LQVDWKRVEFVHEEARYEPEPPSPGAAGQSPTPNVLFQTTFANRTDREQTYTFRAERTTRSTCCVSVEQACTTGVEVTAVYDIRHITVVVVVIVFTPCPKKVSP